MLYPVVDQKFDFCETQSLLSAYHRSSGLWTFSVLSERPFNRLTTYEPALCHTSNPLPSRIAKVANANPNQLT